MAVQMFSTSTLNDVYDALKTAEGSFFGSVVLEVDGVNPAYVLCTNIDETADFPAVLKITGSYASSDYEVTMSAISFHCADGSTVTPYPSSTGAGNMLTTVGICNHGIALVPNLYGGSAIIGKDHYDDYAFLQADTTTTGGRTKIGTPTVYAGASTTAYKQYGITQNLDDNQLNLAHILVPKMDHPYNYITDVYAALSRGSDLTGASHVIVNDDHFISVTNNYFIKD